MLLLFLKQENPYEDFLVRKCKEVFHDSELLLAFHHLSIDKNREKEIRWSFFQKDLYLAKFENDIIK